MASHKLSLKSAILINVNIMLGSGIFINTVVLSKLAGSAGALVYAIVGILLLPLIIAIAKLLQCHQNGGTFFDFGASVKPILGFISSWSYFIGKMASSALGIHVCLSLLQELIPSLKAIPIILFDCLIIILFCLLNLLNLRIGQSIQVGFMFFKLIPIFFAIFAGLFIFSGTNFNYSNFLISGIPISIPLVLYAFSGFEASCSLSNSIENPEKNGPKAILISYCLVILIVMLYQTIFYGALGEKLASMVDYTHAFPQLLENLMPNLPNLKNLLHGLLHIGIASSSLGASYGIMYSNSWNLFTLASRTNTFDIQNTNVSSKFGKSFLTYLNKHNMPYICIIIEAILAIAYIIISQGHQISLQQVSAFGSVIAYTCSAIALLIITYKATKKINAISVLSLISCSILIGAFIWSIATKGITNLFILFLAIIIFGITLFSIKNR